MKNKTVRIDAMLIIGVTLLIIGLIWAFVMNGIGMIEWVLLLVSGTSFGIIAGVVQGWATNRKKRKEIELAKMLYWWGGALVLLIIIKVGLMVLIPSNLTTMNNGIFLTILFTAGGLFTGRSLMSATIEQYSDKSKKSL